MIKFTDACRTVLFAGALASVALLYIPAAKAATETVLHSFRNDRTDGGYPLAGLLKVGGALYGTTFGGGAGAGCSPYPFDSLNVNACGTVFKINPKTGAETVAYSFLNNGTDGVKPWAGLINVGGTLYGETNQGGSGVYTGTVFKIKPETGAETVVYSFCSQGGTNCTDGFFPVAGLIDVGGTLYGTTNEGGASGGCWDDAPDPPGCGTVFKLNPTTGAETVVHSFGMVGAGPMAGLIDVNGTLYGTTSGGVEDDWAYSDGTVFSINPSTGKKTAIYKFCSKSGCPDGASPNGDLIYSAGNLYGTTPLGGAHGGGTVFSIDPVTGAETVVYSFCSEASCTDGFEPKAGLIDVGGALYGTTSLGGANSHGTVFKVNRTTGVETVVYSFKGGNDGSEPAAGLIDVDGTLYGTTVSGGKFDGGTVFSISP
jgi:uncharacterized repeat protein (TIGR03803 family)